MSRIRSLVYSEEEICARCPHQKRTPYGMPYCEFFRRIVSITKEHGVTFEVIRPSDEVWKLPECKLSEFEEVNAVGRPC